MPAPPLHRVRRLSYSALALFERCSYRYYAERVAGLRERRGVVPPAAVGLAATEIGDAVHRLLELVDLRDPSVPDARAGAHVVPGGDRRGARADRRVRRGVLRVGARAPGRGARRARGPSGRSRSSTTASCSTAASTCSTATARARSSSTTRRTLLGERTPEEIVEADYRLQRLVYALACFRAGAEEVEVVYAFLERPDAVVSTTFARARRAGARGRAVRRRSRGSTRASSSRRRASSRASGCPALDVVCAGPRLARRLRRTGTRQSPSPASRDAAIRSSASLCLAHARRRGRRRRRRDGEGAEASCGRSPARGATRRRRAAANGARVLAAALDAGPSPYGKTGDSFVRFSKVRVARVGDGEGRGDSGRSRTAPSSASSAASRVPVQLVLSRPRPIGVRERAVRRHARLHALRADRVQAARRRAARDPRLLRRGRSAGAAVASRGCRGATSSEARRRVGPKRARIRPVIERLAVEHADAAIALTLPQPARAARVGDALGADDRRERQPRHREALRASTAGPRTTSRCRSRSSSATSSRPASSGRRRSRCAGRCGS